MMEIKGAGAIVFGGASGLGEATVRRLVREGAAVVIADTAEEPARRLGEEVGADVVVTDVTDDLSVDVAVEVAARAKRGLRISVACAGIATPGKLIGREGPTAMKQFERVIEINLLGTIRALRAAAAQMSANDPDERGERGVCIQTASVAAFDGQIGQVAYAASKAGVVGLTLPVARELAGIGVRVIAIAPGLFDTPMLAGLPAAARSSLAGTVPFPARLGAPAEYADLVEHIVTNQMLNGEVIRLDGALRLAAR